MQPSPHDSLVKAVFSRPQDARSLFEALLPRDVLRDVDLTTLQQQNHSFVDEELRHRHADLLFSVRARSSPLLVYVLFEHKSFADRWLALQLFVYIGRIWEMWRREHGEGCRLPMILPVVLYHGERPWSQSWRLTDLLGTSGESGAIRKMQPTLPLILIDLARRSVGELERSMARGTAVAMMTVLLMKSIRDEGILERLRAWAAHLRRLLEEVGGRQMLEYLVTYTLLAARDEVSPGELSEVMSREVGPEAEEIVMSTGEKLIQKGLEQGLRQGLEQGLERGQLLEARNGLNRLLRKRFGSVPQRIENLIQQGNLETVRGWQDRAAVAESVEDVFVEKGPRT